MPDDPYLAPRSKVQLPWQSDSPFSFVSRLVFVLINLYLGAGSVFNCLWVLLPTHYSWSLLSKILALATGIAGVLLAASSLLLGKARIWGHILIASMLVITLMDARESFLAYREYGQGLEWQPVLVAVWLIICMVYVRVRPNSSFKPKPLRGSA